MNAIKSLKAVGLLLAACLLTVGCIPVKNVEKAWKDAKADEALVGKWYGSNDAMVGFVKTDQDYLVTSGTNGLEGGCKTIEVNGHKYVIVASFKAAILGFDKMDKDEKNGTLLRYKIEGNSLTMYTYDSDKLAEAIKAKKVPGEIDENDSAELIELDEATIKWLGEIGDQPGWDAQVFKKKNNAA